MQLTTDLYLLIIEYQDETCLISRIIYCVSLYFVFLFLNFSNVSARSVGSRTCCSASKIAESFGFAFHLVARKSKIQRFCGVARHARANDSGTYAHIAYSNLLHNVFIFCLAPFPRHQLYNYLLDESYLNYSEDIFSFRRKKSK